jgi:hypothetical protein
MEFGLVVFKEGTITNDDLHGDRWSQILTQMNGCSIFLSYNFKIKIEHGLL